MAQRLVLLVVATLVGCAEPETGIVGTWYIEISERHLYLTFESDGRVERLLVDEDLDQEVSTGTWEIQDSGDGVKLCTHYANYETFDCEGFEVQTMAAADSTTVAQLVYQDTKLIRIPGFDLRAELARLSAIRDSTQRVSPRVSSTAARSYEADMKSNLRNLVTFQEVHWVDHLTYGSTVVQINLPLSLGVTIELREVSTDGYRGTARHANLPNVACYIEAGSAWQRVDGTFEFVPWCDD